MKVTGPIQIESVIDVRCDVCGQSTQMHASGPSTVRSKLIGGSAPSMMASSMRFTFAKAVSSGPWRTSSKNAVSRNCLTKNVETDEFGLVASDDFFRDLNP